MIVCLQVIDDAAAGDSVDKLKRARSRERGIRDEVKMIGHDYIRVQ